MFDPRDLSSDPRTLTPERPKRDPLKERQDRTRTGSRAEFDPRSEREDFTSRTERAVAEIGMYRTVAYKDLSEAHFDGHPYATRRAVDRMIQQGDVQEQTAKGPQGGTYKVLTLTGKGVHRAEVAAQDQGLDSGQKAWSGRVKSAELQHDTAVFRAARVEQGKLIEKGAVLRRVRIDAELKREVARASETARAQGGKEAADAARVEKAAELGLPVKAGKVEYPDAQLEYDLDGRSGRGGSDSNGAESHVKDASAVGSQGGILSGPSAKDVRSGSIVERWDELLRVAGSLKLGWVTASLLISKLQAGARENVLSRALRDLGRLVKTQFILQWIESEDYRRRIHRQLNKGEALHALRRFLFFAHEGKVQRRQADQQTNQVLCLNLVTNAIVTWSTLYMNAAIEQLRAEGSIGPDVGLGHLSPALYGHINPYGKYRFEIADRPADLRPLRSPENGP